MKRLYDKAVVDEIASKYGNEAVFLSEFSRALLDIIREGLIRDGQVRLHQFGTFKLKWMNSRNGVNPSTGEKMIIQGRPRVIFTPAKGLKDIVEPNPPALQPIEEVGTMANSQSSAEIEDKQSAEETILIKLKSEDQSAGQVSQAQEIIEESIEDTLEDLPDINDNTAVADIQDEIEVLEQVVDILKADAKEEDNLEDSRKDEVASDWLDSPVVEQIREISELQYFKSDNNEKKYPSTDTVNERETLAATSSNDSNASENVSYNQKLDIDLSENAASVANKEPVSKPWFAMAAAVVVLLATGLLINTIWTPGDAEKTGVKYLYSYYPAEQAPIVQDSQLASVETDVIEAAVPAEETAEPVEAETVAEVSVADEADQTESELAVDDAGKVTEPDAIEEDQIVVSTEQYNEVKRASAEESVYFLEREHRLSNGDSLWRLAKKHYINPFYWPHIYQANHKKITNPDRVKIGRVISLPTLYGEPDDLTKRDKRNIAMGYYFNYLYHKQKGNPFAYFSLIGVDKFDADLLIEFQEEISRSDVNNLALLSE